MKLYCVQFWVVYLVGFLILFVRLNFLGLVCITLWRLVLDTFFISTAFGYYIMCGYAVLVSTTFGYCIMCGYAVLISTAFGYYNYYVRVRCTWEHWLFHMHWECLVSQVAWFHQFLFMTCANVFIYIYYYYVSRRCLYIFTYLIFALWILTERCDVSFSIVCFLIILICSVVCTRILLFCICASFSLYFVFYVCTLQIWVFKEDEN